MKSFCRDRNESIVAGVITAYVALLFFLSLNPWILPDSSKTVGFFSWDLFHHAGAYGLLSILLMRALQRRSRPLTLSLVVVLASGALGIFLEFAQLWFTTTRSFSWFDAAANAFGAILGSSAFFPLAQLADFLKKRLDSGSEFTIGD